MNILTGLFVENAMKLAQPEHTALVLDERRKNLNDANQLRNMFGMLDGDNNGHITLRELEEKLEEEHVRAYLSLMGLEIKDPESFFRMISCHNDGVVDLDTFI